MKFSTLLPSTRFGSTLQISLDAPPPSAEAITRERIKRRVNLVWFDALGCAALVFAVLGVWPAPTGAVLAVKTWSIHDAASLSFLLLALGATMACKLLLGSTAFTEMTWDLNEGHILVQRVASKPASLAYMDQVKRQGRYLTRGEVREILRAECGLILGFLNDGFHN